METVSAVQLVFTDEHAVDMCNLMQRAGGMLSISSFRGLQIWIQLLLKVEG